MNECWTLLQRLFILFNSIRYTYSYLRPRKPMINKTKTAKEGAKVQESSRRRSRSRSSSGERTLIIYVCIYLPKGRAGKNIWKKRKDDDDVRRRRRWSNSEHYRHLLLSLHLIHFHKFSKNQSPVSIYKFSKISRRGMKISQNFLRKIVVWGWLKSFLGKKENAKTFWTTSERKND